MKLGFSSEFSQHVISKITPFQHLSGTEHVAPLLYSLIRMLKPETVVEFGTGYTTPYILQALKDNDDDFKFNQNILKKKLAKNYKALVKDGRSELSVDDWLLDDVTQDVYGGEPVVPVPSYYLKPYKPKLFSFEVLPDSDEYVKKLSGLVSELKLDRYFKLNAGCRVTNYVELLPKDRLKIDFAWNDFGNKQRFYEQTYDNIRNDGGVMAFHNTTNSEKDHKKDLDNIMNIIRPKIESQQCELLTFLEPHKFTQRSLTVLRKLSDFEEHYFDEEKSKYDQDLLKLGRVRSDVFC